MNANEKVFQPLGTVICPHCECQNLNWRFVCTFCGKDLEGELDPADRHKQENAA